MHRGTPTRYICTLLDYTAWKLVIADYTWWKQFCKIFEKVYGEGIFFLLFTWSQLMLDTYLQE